MIASLMLAAHLLAPCLSGSLLTAAPTPHARVEAAAKPSGDSLQLVLQVVPASGLHINPEGPWQLELHAGPGLQVPAAVLKRDAVDFKLPGFSVVAKASQPSGQVSYKLTAFVCTDDKAQCYRDVLQGDLNWHR